ncbi:MAG: hypothetical protein COC22_07120 [Flavobacteriaceae bacterium]|nr:MAG: hypothetical protein COC22_07120 [Flavobacteriaceae bacterium]
MIITKIEVKGDEKKPAIVTLEKGLNVISGASDTGKSYICQCVQFILGAEEAPKSIDEAKGYSSLEVTFEESDGGSFILKRELKNNADLTLVENDVTKTLKPNHKGRENLSSYFLGKIGIGNQVLVSGTKSLNHSSLTLRILEKLFLVDEARIITDDSPLGRGQNTERTLETSLLKTLLTGHDDSDVQMLKKRNQSKQSQHIKIENLEDFMSRYFPSDDVDESRVKRISDDVDAIEKSIELAESELDALLKTGSEGIERRNNLASRSEDLNRKLDEDKTVLERFHLLLSKYRSDRERLEANSEAAKYVDSHYAANCPTCGKTLDESSDISVELVLSSNASEIRKMDRKAEGLHSTIHEIEAHKDGIFNELTSIGDELRDLENSLDPNISKMITETRNIIKFLTRKKENLTVNLNLEIKREKVLKEIRTLQVEHDKISNKYEIPDFSLELQQFMQEISRVLTRWDFPNGSQVTYDKEKRDISIGGKPRGHFGKGYRAICFSAFAIGLMNYLCKEKRHVGFVLLDSPLTTYKERDEISSSEENEQASIANNLIYAFYRDLCDFYNDKQIIVLDNQEPSEDIQDNMNYVHFSKNEDIGRYGFFPR